MRDEGRLRNLQRHRLHQSEGRLTHNCLNGAVLVLLASFTAASGIAAWLRDCGISD